MGKLFIQGLVVEDSDGHTRITRGPGFSVAGGREDSHAFAADVAQEAIREADQAGTLRDAVRAIAEIVERRYSDPQ